MLDRLSELAREPSSERRRELLNAVTDLFLSQGTPSREQGDLFGDIVRRVLEDVTVEARAELSGKIADVPTMPRDVMMRLASDEIEVANPVLRLSPVLTDADLVRLASEKGQDHLLAISNRSELSENVTKVLVDRGNNEVLRTVSANEGARFAVESFRKLVDKAAHDPQICAALQRRQDLPAVEQKRLVDTVQDLIAKGLMDLGAGDDLVGRIAQQAMTRIEVEMKQARTQRLEARLISQDVKDGKLTLSAAVKLLADAERQYDLAQVLADREGIKPVQVFRALVADDVAAIATLCKAHEITDEAFAAVCEMRRKRIKTTHEQARAELAGYSGLQAPNAQRTMRFLKMREAVAAQN